jgi:hypothetical protein
MGTGRIMIGVGKPEVHEGRHHFPLSRRLGYFLVRTTGLRIEFLVFSDLTCSNSMLILTCESMQCTDFLQLTVARRMPREAETCGNK